MARHQTPFEREEPPLLDGNAWDLPQRLTRRDGALAAGPDWTWTRPHFEEDDADD
ncbi:hypothetical protein [Brevundimonas sp. LM2]|uniref:hypothetical protein n=1 Tax=Brevundimonas sp. LM2 TaxID=1938605 RepID=UPI0015C54628|nr:hypothetical protein [Brevundimonas sp. LM2]